MTNNIKKIYILGYILILILYSFSAKAQVDSARLRIELFNEEYCDKNSSDAGSHYTNVQIITNYTMNRLLRKDLSLITLDNEGLPLLGNYATLDFADKNAKANLHLSFYNPLGERGDGNPIKSILSVNVNAGLNEGISSLFTNKSLNNEAGITAKWSFLSRKTRYVNNSAIDCNTLLLYRKRLWESFEAEDRIFSVRTLNQEICDSVTRVDNDKAETLRTIITGIRARLDTAKNNKDSCKEIAELKSTTEEYYTHISDARQRQINSRLYDTVNKELRENYLKSRVNFYFDSLIKMETSLIKWDRFVIQWWDINAKLNGEKYNLLNPVLPADSQLSKKRFNRWSIGFTFNRFSSQGRSWMSKYGLLFRAGYNIGNDNSLGGAELKEVITTLTTVDTGNLQRKASGKLNAFDRPFVRFFSHNINLQLSKYLNADKSRAFNFRLNASIGFPEMEEILNPDGKPDIMVGIGYFLTLLDGKDKKGVVNFEVFANLNDILNSGGSASKFYERHEIGLKFGVPFRSIFLND